MKIAILGAGALGCLWYAKLAQSGNNLYFLPDLRKPAPSIHPEILTLEEQENSHSFPLNISAITADMDLLLVTLKAYQITGALNALRPTLPSSLPLCLLHNGMGVIDEVRQLLPDNPLLIATTTQAAMLIAPFHVRHTGMGETRIGYVEPAITVSPSLISTLHDALPTVITDENIEHALLKKLAINAIINPLTTLYQCQNGALLQPQYQAELDKLCAEIAPILTAAGVDESACSLKERANKVIHATHSNFSSMNRDHHYQRRSEIDYINGYLTKLAQQHHLPAKENQRLYHSIKEIERNFPDE